MPNWKAGSLGTKGESNGGNPTGLALAGGAGAPAAGDAIVVVSCSEDNVDWTQAGYTKLFQARPTVGEQFALWAKDAVGGDSNPPLVHTGGAAIVAGCGVIEDCAPVADWVVGAGSSSSGAAGSVDPPEANCLLLMAGGLDDDQAVSSYANASTPETWTEQIEVLTALGTDVMAFLATAPRASDADTGACTFTPAGGNPAGAVVVAIPPPAAGGPELLSLSGSTTPVGALQKSIGKPLGGSSSPAGSIVKSVAKSLAGAVSPSGAIAKLASKLLAGATDPAGTLTSLVVKVLALAGAISPSGAIARLIDKRAAGVTSPQGTIAKTASKSTDGSIAPTGALRKVVTKAFAGAIAPLGAIANAVISASSIITSRFDATRPRSGRFSGSARAARFDAPDPHDTPTP